MTETDGSRRSMAEQWDTPAARWGDMLLGLLFPRRCPVCGRITAPKGRLICPECVGKLSPVRQPVCQRCGKQVESSRIKYCFDCSRRPKSFQKNFALLNYNQAARTSLAAVKYKNRREYLDFYSRALCLRFGKQILRLKPDVIVPVPVHPSRLRSRGFNQAGVLAEKVGRILDIPVCPEGLKRVRKTLPQKELDPSQRLRNLTGAFGPGLLPEKAAVVLLVDDIYTTGSTMEACARVLKSMGAERVYGLTVCIGGGI